ncbi:MAG TPA: hypothetical protein DDY43_13605 [Synechococcales bacterium UBA10510]|nr:hypothetical protein [Synechococcales bacterium UBA10510]
MVRKCRKAAMTEASPSRASQPWASQEAVDYDPSGVHGDLCPQEQRYLAYAQRPRRADASSRYRGVSRRQQTGLWVAQVYWRGRRYFLGSFRSEEEAAQAYNKHASILIGKMALLNEIPPQNCDVQASTAN